MSISSHLRRSSLLAGVLLLAAAPVLAQTQNTKPANCNAWKLDEERNRILFNDPKVKIEMPKKEDRARLRAQGQPAQLFIMKNCNAPDFEADIPVFSAQGDGQPADNAPSAARVIILAERDKWIQIKGHTSYWSGTGWIRLDDTVVLVKY
ncbi:MAG: hypothetical protein ACRD4U_00705 [Candidatus Acidiferrales bacterium]